MALLGINLSHDASVSLTSEEGNLELALSEERLSRKKNHVGVPLLAINELERRSLLDEISTVVVGSHKELNTKIVNRLICSLEDNPSNPVGTYQQSFPGRSVFYGSPVELRAEIEKIIVSKCPRLKESRFVWINHHDSHLGSALGMVNDKSSALLFSLDGEGDGESGAVGTWNRGKIEILNRQRSVDSLGLLYSAVTARYNFKPTHHEGKITGLAAFGNYSEAVNILRNFVYIENGIIRVLNTNDIKKILLGKVIRKFGWKSRIGLSLDEIVSLAESKTTNYADLAYAVQRVLEEAVIEFIQFYVDRTSIDRLSLAGGVFSNVKLNQKISEMKGVRTIDIFPNMGDGGLSVGGIWSYLKSKNKLSNRNLFTDMYLGIDTSKDKHSILPEIKNTKIHKFEDENTQAFEIANFLARGKIVGIHRGRMEFGPRALGNRSILVSAGNKDINVILNKKLKRTEFMPFAPIVLAEKFRDYFLVDLEQELRPFEYMTMTCNVRENVRSLIPAVVHVDGTARPQIVRKEKNPFLHLILSLYLEITGVAVLVNTSFNRHEEPINNRIEESLEALKLNSVDVLVWNENIIETNV